MFAGIKVENIPLGIAAETMKQPIFMVYAQGGVCIIMKRTNSFVLSAGLFDIGKIPLVESQIAAIAAEFGFNNILVLHFLSSLTK